MLARKLLYFMLAIVFRSVYTILCQQCLTRKEIQMQLLQKDRQMLGVHEYEVHKFSGEASTLGLRVGEWPVKIETDMGNGLPFVFYDKKIDDGDLLWVTYRQDLGCISLRIYND
jgi:hypothetical protein